jgi:hypothetical protein
VLAALAVLVTVALALRPQAVTAHTDDTFSFTSNAYSVNEGESAFITIKRTNGSAAEDHIVRLTFGQAGDTALIGSQYLVQNQAFSPISKPFPAGETSVAVQITALSTATTNDRSFTVTLSLPATDDGTLGSPTTATVTIHDNDGPQPATITSLVPASGPTTGGTPVQINGSGFTGTDCNPTGGIAVEFGGIDAQSCQVNGAGTVITAFSPAQGAGTVDVVVNNGNGPSIANPVTANDFTYVTPSTPVVSSVTPASGSIGTVVRIAGAGFVPGAQVFFGLRPATTVVVQSASIIDATAPDPLDPTRPLTVRVIVQVGGLSSPDSAGDSFTYATVGVTGLSPDSGPPGTVVTITAHRPSASGTRSQR